MELNIEGLTQEQIDAVTKLVQSETDKVRTKYSTELKTVNDELAQYKPAEKSDAEKALEQRIANLEAKELQLFFIVQKGLIDGLKYNSSTCRDARLSYRMCDIFGVVHLENLDGSAKPESTA